jgi:DNA/RNA endonuclease G (NUC1)
MKQSLVSVDQLEKRMGLDFFSKLPDDEEKALEAVTATLP